MSTLLQEPVRLRDASSVDRVALNVLIIEDSPSDYELAVHELEHENFSVTASMARTAAEFQQQLARQHPDIVLADYNLGQWSGMEAVRILREEKLDIPVILVSGAVGDITAVECIKRGATDYVLKDSMARLPLAVDRALQEKRFAEERKRAQRELSCKVRELARSNQDLEQFAYVASHDLQEPLRMVAAYVQLLAEKYKGRLDASADRYIDYAVDGATRMQTLIQDLLAYSRCGRDDHPDQSSVDCNAVVERALSNLSTTIAESGAVINFESLPQVHCRASELEQVFQNLIGNAIKFRGAEPPVISISAVKREQSFCFSVADNGIGISPEHSETIFAVFKRLHTRTEYPGNGIGLSICKKIIERHGGRIRFDSTPGKGATFHFTLPAGESGIGEA